MKKHQYKTSLEWTGNKGNGTEDYRSYSRDHAIMVEGKTHEILGSSDPAFQGDPSRYNPEELLLSSISTCHMLWFLHLCSVHHIIVTAYSDQATGIMEEDENGSGRFVEVTLHPFVKVKSAEMIDVATKLHEEANQKCFIANSCNFQIDHQPTTLVH